MRTEENYQFVYTEEELDEIPRRLIRLFFGKSILLFGIITFMVLLVICVIDADSFTWIGIGILIAGWLILIRNINATKNAWKIGREKMLQSSYEFQFEETNFTVVITRGNEQVLQEKIYFSDITRVIVLENHYMIQKGNGLFTLRRSEIPESSVLNDYMIANPKKVLGSPESEKWSMASMLLFIGSLISVLIGTILQAVVSSYNGLFVENTWLFFVPIPIPLASIVFGFAAKSKGYKWKKNVITGIAMTIFLCIYGSFVFMF